MYIYIYRMYQMSKCTLYPMYLFACPSDLIVSYLDMCCTP